MQIAAAETAVTLMELGAVILGLGLAGRLAERLGLSPIPLYLLGGLAFGTGGLLPLDASSEEFFQIGAEIGVVLLLLMLGLEYSASELVDNLRRQYGTGLVDLVLNALPGAVAALLLGWGAVAAVALAGITYISSSGVISKILTDLRQLGNRETPAVLGVLVLEDLAMAAYLPLLTATLSGLSLAGTSLTLVIALGTAGLALYLALRHGRLISKAVASDNPEMLLLAVVGLTLLVAGVAERLQVSAGVGAFLVGIALSGEVAHHARRVITPLRDLFAALFFVFFGLSTAPADIPPVLVTALLLGLVTALTKIATGWYAARRAGVGGRGRWRAGGALVARGEFSLVIAGLAAGAEPRIAPLAAAYVLIMVILGTLTARFAEPVYRRVRNRPSDTPGTRPGTGFPALASGAGPAVDGTVGGTVPPGAEGKGGRDGRNRPGGTPPGAGEDGSSGGPGAGRVSRFR
ncbi:cation:proton antiporter [Streptomyces sp. YIM 98790]|uniref:cation:proton antiporter n=1 Tax=Streptomyces sp. YIM 98790 TaxID=2689077 RepID=UPI001FB6C0D7|nr:cation:proton antiporter [Streptomyces sp. YIM 98790]